MNQDLLKILPGELTGDTIASAERLVYALDYAMDLQASLKEAIANIKRDGAEFMKANNLKSIEISEERKLILTEKKTDRFATNEIFALIGITHKQAKYFRPEFRKTPLKALAEKETKLLYWQDVEDAVELKEINPKIIEAKKQQEVK